MRFMRRRSGRPDTARVEVGTGLESLEGRVLLSGDPKGVFRAYTPSDISVLNPITSRPYSYSVLNQVSVAHNPSPQNSLLGNEGKIVSGQDRAGDQWTIVVHGPGVAIVTDITPNDGALDDNLDTIQLIGTNINSTYVTGTVTASPYTQTSGLVGFNRLVDTSGVRSVILNGFSLEQTSARTDGSANNSATGVFLTGGVQYLSFANIEAPVDTSTTDSGITVQIGDSSTPLKVQPTIVLNHIHNTVFDSTATTAPPNNVPVTSPTVSIVINGQLKALDILSATQAPYVQAGELIATPINEGGLLSSVTPSSQREPSILPIDIPASSQFLFPIVGTTGRTSVQATAVGSVNVAEGATNLTVSRESTPFQNGYSGLSKLGHAHFHGPTDAVGIDVNGPIKSLKFDKGLGNPTGVFASTDANGISLPGTNAGLPANEYGYAGVGLVSGQVTATTIGQIKVKPANVKLQTPSNPAFVQLRDNGEPYYIPRAGNALTNAAIVASGSIGHTQIQGDVVNSEIKSGFHYPSFAAGLEGTRAASKIGKVHQNGNDVNGVVSATYRTGASATYGASDAVVGPGKITGKFKVTGKLYNTGGVTPLDNTGAGFFAKKKTGGYLPPPETPSRPGNQTLIR